jgi:DNA-binding transcriptional MerR regulator
MSEEQQKPAATPKRGRRSGATKLEILHRKRQLRKLLRMGFSIQELRTYAEEQQGMSAYMARRTVDEILREVVDSMAEYDHRLLAATLFDRFEYLHRLALAQKNIAVAHSVCASVAQLFLVRPPEVIITGDNTQDEDKLGDF